LELKKLTSSFVITSPNQDTSACRIMRYGPAIATRFMLSTIPEIGALD
jgi:hypothetical protein